MIVVSGIIILGIKEESIQLGRLRLQKNRELQSKLLRIPCEELSLLQSVVIFRSCSHCTSTVCTKMALFEDEPLEGMLRHFDPGGRRSTMTTSPRVVKLSTTQVRQPLRMKSQVPEVEVVTKVSAKEKKNTEPITEDKKAEQKNDEKKSPARRKVKMRKRKKQEKVADLSD